MAGFNFAKWRQVISAAVAFALFTIPVISSPAHAASLIYQKLSGENFDPPTDIKFDHESRSMAVRVFDDNKDLVIVTLAFAVNVSSTTFSSSSTILRIKFMPALTNFKGNTGNVWVEAPKVPYQGATKIPALASAYASATSSPNDQRKDMSACGALTWMDDVPAKNLVSFQVSRDCFDLPNSFWTVSQVETDIYNSTVIKDVRYTPVEPFFVDLTSIPRPPKVIPKKNQTITAYTQRIEYLVNSPAIQIVSNSSAGTALTFISKTPAVCSVTTNGFIQPKTSGSCQIAVDAVGSETLNPAPTVVVAVTFTKKSQNLYFDPPDEVYLNQKVVILDISAESGLPVQVVSTTPRVCSFPYLAAGPTTAQLLDSGTCSFKVTQAGDALFNANDFFSYFDIYPNPLKTVKPTPVPTTKPIVKPKPKAKPKPSPTRATITCVKADSKDQKITGVNPKCPAGYKKK